MDRHFKCQECSKAFKRACDLRRHELVHSNIRSYPCGQCALSFKVRRHLRRHQLTHDKDTPRHTSNELASKTVYGCSRCSKQFARWQDLTRHIGQVHLHQTHVPANGHHCDHCNSDFQSLAKLRRHRIHHGLPSAFKVADHLRRHQRRCHPLNPANSRRFECYECKARFASSATLQSHEALRCRGNHARSCAICGASFRLVAELRWHMVRKHPSPIQRELTNKQRPNTFSCSHCELVTYFKDLELLQHIVYVHLNTPNAGKSHRRVKRDGPLSGSVRRLDLVRHRHVLQEAAFRCTHCDASFNSLAYRMLHQRQHAKSEQSFQCAICRFSFKRRGILRKHLLLHGPRVYKCGQCTASFSCAGSLARHATTHSPDRPYSCAACPKAFRRKDTLNEHQRRHHAPGRLEGEGTRRTSNTRNRATSSQRKDKLETVVKDHKADLRSPKSSSQPPAAVNRQHQTATSRKTTRRRLTAETKVPAESAKLRGSRNVLKLRHERDRSPNCRASIPQKQQAQLQDDRTGSFLRPFPVEGSCLRSRDSPQRTNNSLSSPTSSSHGFHLISSSGEISEASKVRRPGRPSKKSSGPGQKLRATLGQPRSGSTVATISEGSKLRQLGSPANASESTLANKPAERLHNNSSAIIRMPPSELTGDSS